MGEHIKDDLERGDGICSAVLMLGHLELEREILTPKYMVSFTFKRVQAHSLSSEHTYCYHKPHSDGMECACKAGSVCGSMCGCMRETL